MDAAEALLLARAQFGLNIAFHILFPTLTIALAWFLVYFWVRYERSRDAGLAPYPRAGAAADEPSRGAIARFFCPSVRGGRVASIGKRNALVKHQDQGDTPDNNAPCLQFQCALMSRLMGIRNMSYLRCEPVCCGIGRVTRQKTGSTATVKAATTQRRIHLAGSRASTSNNSSSGARRRSSIR